MKFSGHSVRWIASSQFQVGLIGRARDEGRNTSSPENACVGGYTDHNWVTVLSQLVTK